MMVLWRRSNTIVTSTMVTNSCLDIESKVLKFLSSMKQNERTPNVQTFNAILSAFRKRDVNKLMEYFDKFKEAIEPNCKIAYLLL
jgi:hypothetical protein